MCLCQGLVDVVHILQLVNQLSCAAQHGASSSADSSIVTLSFVSSATTGSYYSPNKSLIQVSGSSARAASLVAQLPVHITCIHGTTGEMREVLQAYLAMPCLGLVTDLPLIRWASRASDGTQGPSGRWSESLTKPSFEKISPRLSDPSSAASTRRLGVFHDRRHGPPCPRGPD